MKKTLKVAAVVLAAMIIAGVAFLIVVRGQFSAHLKEAYPGKTFSVGFVIVDPISGNFVSKADCLDDYTNFTVSKSWNTKKISDNYPASKSQMQYNAMIGDVFEASPIIVEIESVTGGGKKPFDGSGNFDQINFYLADEKEHASDIEAILRILDASGIEAQMIICTYEMDKHVYVARLSSEDYGLSSDEIKNRIEMLK